MRTSRCTDYIFNAYFPVITPPERRTWLSLQESGRVGLGWLLPGPAAGDWHGLSNGPSSPSVPAGAVAG